MLLITLSYSTILLFSGHLAPIFTKTQRKLKIYDLQLLHRNLFYSTTSNGGGGSGSTNPYDGLVLDKISLVDTPYVIQCESYRSIAHLHSQIVDQMIRYLPDRHWLLPNTAHSPRANGNSSNSGGGGSSGSVGIEGIVDGQPFTSSWPLPFKVRLLSTQNVYAAPQLRSPLEAAGGGDGSKALPMTNKDRLALHKQWEGQEMDSQASKRPVSNLFHQKLFLAIDWEYLHLPPPATTISTTLLDNRPRGLSLPRPLLHGKAEEEEEGVDGSRSSHGSYITIPAYCQYRQQSQVAAPAQTHAIKKHTSYQDIKGVAAGGGGGGDGSPRLLPHEKKSFNELGPEEVFRNHASFVLYRQQQQAVEGGGGYNKAATLFNNQHSPVAATTPLTPSHNTMTFNTLNTTSNSLSPQKDSRAGLTLDEVLTRFLECEEIDYRCDHCAKMQKGAIYTSLHRLPDVLILHLKRLVINMTGGMKVRTLVKFPLQDLALHQYSTEALQKTFPISRHIATPATPGQQHEEEGQGTAAPTPVHSVPPPSIAQTQGGVAVTTSSTTKATASTPPAPAPAPPVVATNSASNECDNLYEVFGVVNHLGGMFGGHYTSYAKCEMLPASSSSSSSAAATPTIPGQRHGAEISDLSSLSSKSLLSEHIAEISPFLPSGNGGEGAAGEGGLGLSDELLANLGQALPHLLHHQSQEKWFKFDDEFVAEISDQPGLLYQTLVSGNYLLLPLYT